MRSHNHRHRERRKSSRALVIIISLLAVVILVGAAGLMFLLNGENIIRLSKPTEPVETIPQETVPVPVVAANGSSTSVMCKQSYTIRPESVPAASGLTVAKVGDSSLTNAVLQIYYSAEVSRFQHGNPEVAPDLSLPLDCQLCPLGDGNLSWQHYFLERAIQTWQAQQAMVAASRDPQKIKEEEFKPLDYLHEEYIAKELPVNNFLYADKSCYIPNELHQEYLNNLPKLLNSIAQGYGFEDLDGMAYSLFGGGTTGKDILEAASAYNLAYMYFTEYTYDLEPTESQIALYIKEHADELPEGEVTVDVRHVLLVPEGADVDDDGKITASSALWAACRKTAESIYQSWSYDYQTTQNRDANFARLANTKSQDAGSRLNGGLYTNVRKGQLIAPVDEWCFAEGRKTGQIEMIESDVGLHILYLKAFHDTSEDAAREAILRAAEELFWYACLSRTSLSVNYANAALWTDCSEDSFSLEETLYPDVAHERFPLAITYLQQDYMYHPYGGSYVGRGGCGVTTMAMLATYMTDKIYSPAMLATRYPYYHDASGTDGNMFRYVPAELGFYMEKTTTSIEEAIAALKAGKRVISLQYQGHFTSGGHYLLLQHYNEEDDTFQIRDSNIYNYGKLPGHKVDRFTRATVLSGNTNFWIMEPKITRIPACSRCGDTFEDRGPSLLLNEAYTCERCVAAQSRRENFLSILNGFCDD